MPNSTSRKWIPEGYRRIEGSERSPKQDMRLVGAADSNEMMRVLLRLKGGAGEGGFDRLVAFLRSKGLRVVAACAEEGSMLASTTVAQASDAFAVEVRIYEGAAGRRRGYEGDLHLPAGLAEMVDEVVGLVEGEMQKTEYEIERVLRCYRKGRKGTGVASYKVLDLVVPTLGPQGPVAADEFNLAGMYDIDVLVPSVSPTFSGVFSRLLQNMAASPGAFDKVRVFKCLNSGETETNTQPGDSGTVWSSTNSPPNFTITMDGLAALVGNNLTPYVVLGFFPTAVSSAGPTSPPADWTNWQTLVQNFLSTLTNAISNDSRFKQTSLNDWWFEVWNEPNFNLFWLVPQASAAPDLYALAQQNYFGLYQATSEAVAAWETASGLGVHIRLGGPSIAYDAESDDPPLNNNEFPGTYIYGKAWMQAFLNFVTTKNVRCDFVSFHRKNAWGAGFTDPTDIDSVVNTADEVATMAKTAGLNNLTIINNEADMRAGVGLPYLPWMEQHFAAWMTGLMIAYDSLSSEYSVNGFRFMATSDNAHLELVNGPFDGRRSIMTLASVLNSRETTDDLLKVPIYNYYEVLRLLGTRHGTFLSGSSNYYPHTDLFHAITVNDDKYITSIFAVFPRVEDPSPASPWTFNYSIIDIPWPSVNVAVFEIDASNSNAFTAAGGSDSTLESQLPLTGFSVGLIRPKQELASTIVTKQILADGTFRDSFTISPYAIRVYWITPYQGDEGPAPGNPTNVNAIVGGANVILTWTPVNLEAEPWFYTYIVWLLDAEGNPSKQLSPPTLRAALWVDTGPTGTVSYGVQAKSASGVTSAIIASNSVTI
jgi:hypothetical protein